MGLVVVNDLGVLEGSRITLPRAGAWHADLVVDKPDALTGAVSINIGEGTLVLRGTVVRGGAFVETARVQVVGGADGLSETAEPKHYTGVSLGLVLGDLLKTAGETLSPTADSSVLARGVEHWTTLGLPIGRIIGRLMSTAAPDATWRVLPDGTVWVGIESWPDSGLAESDYEITHQADDQDMAVIGIEVPRLLPGTELGGRRVSVVQYHIDAGIRMEAWFGDGEHDRFKAAIAGAVKGAVPDLEYRVWYEATIDHQAGNLIDVAPDAVDMVPTMGSVPLAFGVPGVSCEGAFGGKALVGWAGGDPSKPRAFAFDPSLGLTKLVIAAPLLFLGAELGAEPPPRGIQLNTAIETFAGALGIYAAAIKATADPSGAATTALTAAITLLTTQLTAALAPHTRVA
jgi:hypothetical protein